MNIFNLETFLYHNLKTLIIKRLNFIRLRFLLGEFKPFNEYSGILQYLPEKDKRKKPSNSYYPRPFFLSVCPATS